MSDRLIARMKRAARSAASIAALVLLAAGCGPSSEPGGKSEEAQLKADFSKRGALNINDVPPAQRERVRALMNANAPSAPKAEAPSH